MSLTAKYQPLLDYGRQLGIANLEAAEEGGKLRIKGTTTYQAEKDLFWDRLKTLAGWEGEVSADIRTERDDIHGYHVVQSGDTLSKIAKLHFDNANRYMEIFNANKDLLKDPNLIHPGQKLVIPKK
ncbi:MAG: LysM peptidoglycan-binding domain-containing protein [Acidobacteria bacterium]|nr:LysM peptidoglycan-binding domain-containing protein [Acidobacteriota bacterium]